MKRFLETLYSKPRLIVGLIAVITLFFAFQLPRAKVDNNNFRFIPENDPSRLTLAKIDETFGSQVFILIGLERRFGSVFEAPFLETLRSFCDSLNEHPLVDSIQSLVTADFVGGDAESIIVEPLLPSDFDGSAAAIAKLRERLSEWDLFDRALVSDDAKAAQVIVALDVDSKEAGDLAAVAAYEEIVALSDKAGFEDTIIHITGVPVFSSVINDATAADLRFLIPLVAVIVLAILFLSFRRLGGLILPMLTVAISAIWAIGAMAFLDIKLSIISTVLPVILVAVGSAYGIHVVSHYYDERADGREINADTHRRLVVDAMVKIGRPVFLAALTTFAGFLSLCFTPIIPIREFGIFASFGVAIAFLVSVSLIPSLFILRGPAHTKPLFSFALGRQDSVKLSACDAATENKSPGSLKSQGEDPLSTAIADSLMVVTRKKRTVLFLSLVLIIASLAGISRLIIDNVMVEYFKPDTVVAKADAFIRQYFGGSKTVSVVVSHPTSGEVLRPDVLAAMDGLSTYLEEEVPEVGKVAGFPSLIKRMNQLFHSDEPPDAVRRRAAPAAADSAAFGFSESEEASFGFGQTEEDAFGFDAFEEPAFGFTEAEAMSFGESDAGGVSETIETYQEPLYPAQLASLLSSAAVGARADTAGLVKNLRQALNYKGAAYYEIPISPERYGKADAGELKAMIANYLVLLSGDIGAYADDPLEPKAIRLDVQLRTVGQRDTDMAMAAMRAYIEENFPKDIAVEIGGTALVEQALSKLVVSSQLISIAGSLLMVFIIMAVFYRSLAAGFLCLITLSISILINFGVMGAFGIKLNIGTAMVASIVVGTGIDYIIHYLAAYHHEWNKGGDYMRRTFLTSGKAILFNAASVGAGFAVLAFSQFTILAYLGILIALAMFTSSMVSLTILPALLSLFDPAFIKRPLPFDEKAISEVNHA